MNAHRYPSVEMDIRHLEQLALVDLREIRFIGDRPADMQMELRQFWQLKILVPVPVERYGRGYPEGIQWFAGVLKSVQRHAIADDGGAIRMPDGEVRPRQQRGAATPLQIEPVFRAQQYLGKGCGRYRHIPPQEEFCRFP